MIKPKLNLIIDVLLLWCICAITGIGLLMKYVLVPGYLRRQVYGQNVNPLLWSMNRHQWGKIHFIIALVFLALLVIHIILHWQSIACLCRQILPNKIIRWLVLIIILGLAVLLMIGPYLAKPELKGGGGLRRRQRQQLSSHNEVITVKSRTILYAAG